MPISDTFRDIHFRSDFWIHRRNSAIILYNLKRVVESALKKLEYETTLQPIFRKGCEYAILSKGKRIRPILVLLVNRTLGGDDTKIMPVALATEIGHNASLILDDIMDKSLKRRGKKSVYAKYGKAEAILIANYMIFKSIRMLIDIEMNNKEKNELIEILCDCFENMIEGQWLDLNMERKKTLTLETYIDEIRKKTSQIFEYGMVATAKIAKTDDKILECVREMGRNIGILFQIRDDILDFIGDERLGKPRMKDFAEGKRTIPILMSMFSDTRSENKEEIFSLLGKPRKRKTDRKRILEILNRTNAIESSSNLALEYAEKTKKLVKNSLPLSEERKVIEDLIDYICYRVV